MYSKDFYITDPVGNNAFSYDQRVNKALYVPSLKEIEHFDQIELQEKNTDKISFEEYDFDGNMQSCYGLKNFYKMMLRIENREVPLYLVDNHNHVLYFWYLARSQGIIHDGATLYHVDEHADTRDPGKYLFKSDSHDMQKVFEYTNFFLNVGNYIIPAEREGVISETIQIRGEQALQDYLSTGHIYENNSILNLDLDFFEPELDFIDHKLKLQVIRDIASHANLITVCTSPYFIDQVRALRVFKEVFDM